MELSGLLDEGAQIMAAKHQLQTTFPLSLQPPTETRSFMRDLCTSWHLLNSR